MKFPPTITRHLPNSLEFHSKLIHKFFHTFAHRIIGVLRRTSFIKASTFISLQLHQTPSNFKFKLHSLNELLQIPNGVFNETAKTLEPLAESQGPHRTWWMVEPVEWSSFQFQNFKIKSSSLNVGFQLPNDLPIMSQRKTIVICCPFFMVGYVANCQPISLSLP